MSFLAATEGERGHTEPPRLFYTLVLHMIHITGGGHVADWLSCCLDGGGFFSLADLQADRDAVLLDH